jgi:hypothetical protein
MAEHCLGSACEDFPVAQEHREEFNERQIMAGKMAGVELESNLLICQVRAEIATEMLRPRTGKNSVMQLNTGDRKSSVGRRAVCALRRIV